MNGWQFTHEADGWHWHRISESGEPARRSARGFGTLPACLDDAKMNGYSLILAGRNWTPQRLPGL